MGKISRHFNMHQEMSGWVLERQPLKFLLYGCDEADFDSNRTLFLTVQDLSLIPDIFLLLPY